MDRTFQATYEDGVLRLDTPLGLPEHARVTGLVTGVQASDGATSPRTAIPDDEFERLLEEFAIKGAQPLPADFSRADIYCDHD